MKDSIMMTKRSLCICVRTNKEICLKNGKTIFLNLVEKSIDMNASMSSSKRAASLYKQARREVGVLYPICSLQCTCIYINARSAVATHSTAADGAEFECLKMMSALH